MILLPGMSNALFSFHFIDNVLLLVELTYWYLCFDEVKIYTNVYFSIIYIVLVYIIALFYMHYFNLNTQFIFNFAFKRILYYDNVFTIIVRYPTKMCFNMPLIYTKK